MKKLLYEIKDDLSRHKNKPCDALEIYIKQRLSKANNVYNYEINKSLEFLLNRNNLNILNRIGKK